MIYLPDRKRTWTGTFRLTSLQYHPGCCSLSPLSFYLLPTCHKPERFIVIAGGTLPNGNSSFSALHLSISLVSPSQLLIQFRSCLCHFGLSLVPKNKKQKKSKSKTRRKKIESVACLKTPSNFASAAATLAVAAAAAADAGGRSTAETFGKIFIAIIYCSLEFIVYDTFQLLVAC